MKKENATVAMLFIFIYLPALKKLVTPIANKTALAQAVAAEAVVAAAIPASQMTYTMIALNLVQTNVA